MRFGAAMLQAPGNVFGAMRCSSSSTLSSIASALLPVAWATWVFWSAVSSIRRCFFSFDICDSWCDVALRSDHRLRGDPLLELFRVQLDRVHRLARALLELALLLGGQHDLDVLLVHGVAPEEVGVGVP